MFRSVFLRKMIFMVLVALCASALLSATLFRYAANAVTKQNEETLLIEKAHALSDFLNTHLQQEEMIERGQNGAMAALEEKEEERNNRMCLW